MINEGKGDDELEAWKDIEGYGGRYQVSNLGNVRSLKYRNKECVQNLKPITSKNGYLYVNLNQRHKYIHALVANSFLCNSDNKPAIDHVNTFKTDNNVKNLRFATHKENSNNTITLSNISIAQKGKKAWNKGKTMSKEIDGYVHPRARKVECLETGNIFESAKDASDSLSCDNSAILKCCKGTQRSAGGYHWIYV